MHSLRHLSHQLNVFRKALSPDPPPVSARRSRPTSLLCPRPPARGPEPSHLVRLVRLVCSKLCAAWTALRLRPDSPRPAPFDSPRRSHFGLKTLVLDLDETLIHSTSRPIPSRASLIPTPIIRAPAHTVDVVLAGRRTQYHVYKRPFVDFFLRTVSGWYTLVIFTASMKEYADPVIDWLDAGRGILVQRLFRDSCTQLPNGSYTKDLSIVEQDLSRVCLVDNSPISYNVNQANGIPIEGWTDDPSDQALLDLLPVLDSLRFTKDVRHILGLRSAGLCPSPS
ncbi:Nuclear envelope morphology protein 1 [Leucoagaricus gongylophorus]